MTAERAAFGLIDDAKIPIAVRQSEIGGTKNSEILRPLILCFAGFLASCATPYESTGFLGGYSDTALAPDVYRISFQGNGYTSQETVGVNNFLVAP
jgi:hypothetical protein